MLVLGIHYGHDANVSLVKNGELVFAVSEERLTRRKNQR
ncbi:MAG: carbamoyltransferase N-terminal domain-containing protein [Candidatus Thiodiazotropha sp.]